MKNFSMINNSKELAWFCRNHYNGLMVVCNIRKHLRHRVPASTIATYIKQVFANGIEKHFLEEEICLFPKLSSRDVLRIQAETQHATLRRIVSELEHSNNIEVTAEEFANALEEHIRFEERTLFPHLNQLLSKRMKEISTVNPAGFIGVC
jgi:hemerythrin-like domain-containing protein